MIMVTISAEARLRRRRRKDYVRMVFETKFRSLALNMVSRTKIIGFEVDRRWRARDRGN